MRRLGVRSPSAPLFFSSHPPRKRKGMSTTPGDPSAADSPGTPERWLVLYLVAADYLLLYGQRSLIGFLKRPLMADLNLQDDQFGWLGVAYHLPYAVAQIGAGYLGDRFSRRTVLFWSMFLSAVTVAAMGSAADFAAMFVLRIVLGVAQSASVPAIAGAMADSFTPKSRSTAVGVYVISYNLGLVLAATFSGQIADTPVWTIPLGWIGGAELQVSGWRMAFFLFAVVSVVGALVFWRLFPEPARTERPAGGGQASFVSNVVLLVRTPTFLALAVCFVLWSMILLAIQLWLPGYVEKRFLPSQLGAANFQATIWIQLATVAGLLLGGRLSDGLARRRVSGRILVQVAGLVAMAPAMILIGAANDLRALY